VDPARPLGPAQIDVLAQLAVATILLGGIYALIAVGLTLVFGIMRVVNFAHGEFLMLGMYLAFWTFTLYSADPYVVVFVSIPVFFVVGLLSYVLVMRGVIHASHNVQIFTTVGLSVVLQNVALVAWSGDFRFVRPWHLSTVLRAGSTTFNLTQVVAFLIAVALTISLVAFMKWTHAGRVMRATAQDRDAATLMGIDTDRVYRLTFAIGIAAVGAAGVLVAPLYSVYPTAGLQFVLLSYVVVVLGGLGDMLGAMLGSLIVAAVEVAGSYLFGTAWKEIFYFILFILVLVFRPAGLFGQRRRDPGRLRMSFLVRSRRGALVVFGLAAVTPLVVRDAYFLDSLVLILLWGALSAAWNVAGGYAGQVSIGHASFFGIGAYAAALMVTRFGRGPWLGMLVGVVLSIGAGFIIGFLSNRLKGPYFALSTIAFSQVLLIGVSRWRGFTAGGEGIPVPFRPGFATLGLGHVGWVYMALGAALLCYRVEVYLERSRIGYQLAGVREDEDAAEALGIPARRLKVFAVTLSAALTSVCGSLWAQYVGFVDPTYVFSVDLSVRFALNAIIGGMGTALGPYLGSILITSLETYLRATFSGVKTGFAGIYLIIYGTALILVVRFVPEGLAGVAARLRARRAHA